MQLVLLRHGESQWNLENRFTGWVDVPLSERGCQEAREAGRLLRELGGTFDTLHTSLLRRAIETAHLALSELDQLWLPVKRSWRLNERHYGALQGLDKKETAAKHGADQVKVWRRSYATPPPPLALGDATHPKHDPRYAQVAPELLPTAECLQDTVARLLPYWHDTLVPELLRGERPLVVAHGNSLRALVKHLEGMGEEAIVDLNIPTGVPLVYELDGEFKPVNKRYLGDVQAAAAAAAEVAAQAG